MHPDLIKQFDTDIPLVNRFNAGANLLWAKPRRKRSIPKQPLYEPPAAGGSLETVIAEQMADHRWRIDRYARGSMLKTPFYQRAKKQAPPRGRRQK